MSPDELKALKIMVMVSSSPYSAYIIRWTYNLARRLRASWIALYVEDSKVLSEKARQQLTLNLSLAAELKAEVVSIYDKDIINGVIEVARQRNITSIVVGKSGRVSLSGFLRGGSLSERLSKTGDNLDIFIVTPAGQKKKTYNYFAGFSYQPLIVSYFIAVLSIMGITLINFMLVSYIGYWTIALIYLLFISVFTLLTTNYKVVLPTAALSGLLWNFLFIPPLYTFNIGKIEDTLMFVMYLVIALIIATLISKLRIKEKMLRSRERRISALFHLSNEMEEADGFDEILKVGVRYICEYFNVEIALFLTNETGDLSSKAHAASTFKPEKNDYRHALHLLSEKRINNPLSYFARQDRKYFLPLITTTKVLGIFVIKMHDVNKFTLEQEIFLRNITHQFTVILEREMLAIINRKNVLLAESEKLYNILLSSVSHELRTPLTTITGSATSLMDKKVDSNVRTRKSLIIEIKKASDRLNRLVGNFLDMSRLEAGMLKLHRQLYDMRDVVDFVLNKLRDELADHKTITHIEKDLPLIAMDFPLIEQALTNIIYNALVHTPPGTVIMIRCFPENENVHLEISDNGPGLLEADIPHIFDKFRRGSKSMHSGIGIGLAICKGIIEAHNGKLTAGNNKNGGAIFDIRLPIPQDKYENKVEYSNV
jgi:two-component system sensor histidine kinase KdpD